MINKDVEKDINKIVGVENEKTIYSNTNGCVSD